MKKARQTGSATGKQERVGGLGRGAIRIVAVAATLAACDGTQGISGLDPAAAHAIEVTPLGSGRGLVRSEPEGLACGTECRAVFPEGTRVRLIAEPLFGSTFAGWSGECDGFLPECELEVIGERFVGVRFTTPAAGDAGVVFDGGIAAPDSGAPGPDAGEMDAGVDGGLDAATGDGAVEDGAVVDAGVVDAG